MRIIQDSLRKKQSLLASAVVTCLLICLALFFLYQRALSQVNESIHELQNQMMTMFTDNELMAEAAGVRYQQVSRHFLCGEADVFHPRGDDWGINANPGELDNQHGALVAKKPDRSARCLYVAAEYIRDKVRALNPEQHDTHRYIIDSNGNWFYWFNAADSVPFTFSSSQMANNPRAFFAEPEMFYDRVLQKSMRKKSLSVTNFYEDKITGDKAYSVVSYIYDLSEGDPSNHIIGYLAYDLSRSELLRMLQNAFNHQVPRALILGLQSRQTGEVMCIVNNCRWLDRHHIHEISSRYEITYALPVWLFILNDGNALAILAMAPALLILLFFLIRYHLNHADLRFYRDPLTGCFTRNIFALIQQRSLPFTTVILFDCNKFKQINDSYGHQAGDRALQAIAQCMLGDVRANGDWVIRSGGDEFIVLLSRTDIAHAHIIAERIAAKIAVFPFSPEEQPVPLSVSWGVAPCLDSLDNAIQQADEQMYQMKNNRGEKR
ncbi:GGDEF domain-containing protein [Kluyvera cryocrescens]|uniref:GGDEF domain-containing protein n=1 Tax=Kluyvera cryocrescens TaxID=580 RepID=UPI00248CF77E|nr:GGDEF domain-containing protein [Kluyvera cryocrescens]